MSNTNPIDQCTQLNKSQSKRLRYYFSQGNRAFRHELDGTDLDLVGFKLIETAPDGYSGNKIKLTDFGIELLHKHRQADIASRSVHHDLGSRLAAYLRKQGRITWENVEFRNWVLSKPIRNSNESLNYPHWQCVRPDVFSIMPSLQFKNSNPCIHEVKVSRGDFLADRAKPEKRNAYAMMAEAVYYVAIEGLIEPAELPQGFGLLVERSEGEFVLAKRARRHKVELQAHHYLNMIVKPGMYPDDYRL